MNDQTDQQLLRDFAGHRSEPAFTELVRRHVDLVHSAALRMTSEPHSAQDVTQAVFVTLAQNAARLTQHPVLSGWMHTTARNLAAKHVRATVRRQNHEQEAAAMNELLSTTPDASWDEIALHLDAALGELSELDRDAILLRYFEKKTAGEIAASLGASAEAAQKRVSRAVERLREYFAKRGVAVGATGLVVAISANAVQAAPVGLIVAISTAAMLAGTIAGGATATVAQAIAMTTFQKTILGVLLATAVGAGIYEACQASSLRKQVQTLQQQQAPLGQQLLQATRDRDEATNLLALLRDESLRLNRNSAELLRLRGQIGLARREISDLRLLQKENVRLISDSPPSREVTLDTLQSLQEQIAKLEKEFEALSEKIETMATSLSLPTDVGTNTSAFVASSGLGEQYPLLYQAFEERDGIGSLLNRLSLLYSNVADGSQR